MPQSQDANHAPFRGLAVAGLAGVAAFVLAVVALHATSLAHEPWHMSEFANTRFWLLWAIALLGFAVGGALLTFALRPQLARSGWQRAGLAMLWLAGIGAVVMAACPVDRDAGRPSLPGTIHERVGPPTFALSGAAMVVLVPAFRSCAAWRPFARPSLVMGIGVSCSALAYVSCTAARWAAAALAQRLLVGLIAAWFILLATRLLRQHGPNPPSVPLDERLEARPGPTPPRKTRQPAVRRKARPTSHGRVGVRS
ncbi:MAG: DUF998 domain-containing protein [bacterium]